MIASLAFPVQTGNGGGSVAQKVAAPSRSPCSPRNGKTVVKETPQAKMWQTSEISNRI